jgi:hypothetical protein
LKRLVDALEAVDEFLDEGFAGFSPEQPAADAAVFFDGQGEGQEHFDILLNVFGGDVVEFFVFEGFGEPWGVEAEVDTDVSILLEGGIVKLGAEAEDADGRRLKLPDGIEAGGFEAGIEVDGGIRGLEVDALGGPKLPTHLELVGHVVVKLFGGLSYGAFDEGGRGVFGTVVVDVDALVGGGFIEADGVDAGCGNSLVSADERELAHDRHHRGRECVQAEVGKPEAKVELIGHMDSLVLWAQTALGAAVGEKIEGE